jgi:hypothetical protein
VARHAADPADTWAVFKDGSDEDIHIRAHCTDRTAGVQGRKRSV